jgi:excisionase family DNA binding protein
VTSHGAVEEIAMSTQEEFPEILTIEQAAKMLQVSARTIQRLVKTGTIPGRQVGTKWRFHRDQLRDWVRNKEARPKKGMSQAELIEAWAKITGVDLPQPLIDYQQELLRRSLEKREP